MVVCKAVSTSDVVSIYDYIFLWDEDLGVLRFNVDRAAKGKPGPAGIGGLLRDNEGLVLVMFSKHVGTMEFNEAKVLAIVESIQIFASSSFHSRIEVEIDSLKAISWVSSSAVIPWIFQFYLNEIRVLTSSIRVKLQHVGRWANNFADLLAKQGVDKSSNLVAFIV